METAFAHILTNSYKAEMISSMQAHPEYFDEAISLAVSNKQPYAWRAAWLLWSCMAENDQRIQKQIGKIVSSIQAKNDSHQRELLKILLQMELSEKHEVFLLDSCIKIWEGTNKKPSVRFTAFKMMVKIAKKHPDLHNEVALLTEDQYMNSFSAAAKKSIRNRISETKRIN